MLKALIPEDQVLFERQIDRDETETEELESRIRKQLYSMQDPGYQKFQVKLIPTLDPARVIGIRLPELRKFAKEFAKTPEAVEYLKILPHRFYDENNLHGCLIESIKDYDVCVEALQEFLPYIDNWATCDMLAPKVLGKHRQELLEQIQIWIHSDQTYTVRYGIGMLMRYFLDEDFEERYLELVSSVRSEEYYIRMMVAWYFATALAKQYDATVKYIENQRLEPWVHNKAIQKARESCRVTAEQKEYLQTLKVKIENTK